MRSPIGFSALVGSSLLTAVMVGNVVEKLLVGWLNDRVGVQFTVNIQLAMVALGFAGFMFAGDNLVLLYASAFLFGAQNSLVSVSTPLLVRQLFGERDFPAIFTYARIGTGVIGCLGPVTVAAIFDATAASCRRSRWGSASRPWASRRSALPMRAVGSLRGRRPEMRSTRRQATSIRER